MVLIAKLVTLALTAAATPIFRRDAARVQRDINEGIEPEIETLSDDVAAFPASGSTGSLDIHNDFQNLLIEVNYAIADTNSSDSFDYASGSTLLDYLQEVTTSLSAVLASLKDQESAWSDFPEGKSLILSDLQALKTAFDNFADALTTKEPFYMSNDVSSIKNALDIDFSSAIDAYSS
ncbi:hypothetical protein AnigIFM56816_004020 [Aspergillus niger]|nr:hypothetical protein AnigIFM56816_004020 [Aspergillus niger]